MTPSAETSLFALWMTVSTVWCALSILAVARVRARRAATLPKGSRARVTVLKPLCGADDLLEENLRTFFEQDHPAFQVVFGVQDKHDPALLVARKLCREYPQVQSRIVVHEGVRSMNPKVANLQAMLDFVHDDVVVISDSNVRVPKKYLSQMHAELLAPRVGLVTHLFAGTREQTLGAAFENLHLSTTVMSGVAASREWARHPIVVGKSMMFRQSELASLGGFDSVGSVLAEDYVIGRMYHEAGYEVAIAPMCIENVVAEVSVKSFIDRQVRWAMIRRRLAPIPYMLEALSLPIVVLAAAHAMQLREIVSVGIWALSLTLLRDATLLLFTRRAFDVPHLLLLSVPRDVLWLAAWAIALVKRHVRWRGKRVRVSSGTRLYASRDARVHSADA